MKEYLVNLLLRDKTDGTWFPTNSDVTYQINSIVFVNPNTGWMVGNNLNGNLSKSTNGGLN